MNKKICISGYYGFDNFGDETILKILVDNLKTFIELSDITVFSANPKKTSETLEVRSIHTFNPFLVLSAIFKTDYLISGGGSLLQDKTSIKSLIYYLSVFIAAFLSGKKVIIFAQGIGPINNIILKNLTLFLLKKALYITVRDEESFKLLSDYGIKNVEKCSDPAWNITVKKSEKKGRIGVQLRDFPLITNDFLLKLAQNINKYYSDKEIYILSLQNNIDLDVCRNLEYYLKEINSKINVKIVENTSNNKVITDLCNLEALIAMRYHACLIGVKAGIKVLPINYDIKIKALANDFNLICINSENDIDEKFNIFVKSDFIYNEIKIKTKKFDFTKLKNVLMNI